MAVYDGANYAQLLRQVAQTAQQIQLLEQQLQQQAAMLANLRVNVTAPLAVIEQQANTFLQQAAGIGYGSSNTAQSFASAYPATTQGMSMQQVYAALSDWQARTRTTLMQSMSMQSQVAQAQPQTAGAVSAAVAASQGASGQTAAIQATTQVLAALSTQLSQLQTLTMTASRAAESATVEQQSVALASASESARALQYAPPSTRITNGGHL